MSDPLVDPIGETAKDYADAVEQEYITRRELMRTEAEIVASLIGQPNPMTGKPHSASSASEYAKTCDTIMDIKDRVQMRELNTIRAKAQYEMARVRAWLSVGVPS